ncbi:hypothetical protein [Acetobacterium wieringae]|uniref:hypothetical protein n=1 Tax=Acetobacterium wieringae TaxID=52694 RepID=UPI0026EA6984|nr:hypothetical protein [Acetobacterium wieringae]
MVFKERVISWLNWIKTTVMENKLRTGALLCTLLALAGFFLPFMSAKMSASVTGIMNNTLEIISPEYDMINFSLSDFVFQEPIDAFEVYGVPLGNIKVLDQSVLDILRSPLPDKGYISRVNEALASPALDYLVDPQVQQIVITNFNNGETINGILKDLWSVIQSARNIASQVNDITIQARQSMDQVNATMATIDSYKATANGVILILFLVVIGLMALILYRRASIKLSIFISGVLSVLFLGAGIGTAVANNRINEQLSSLASQINNGMMEALRAILVGTFGDVGSFIANYISSQANFVAMAFTLQLEVGYWIILLGLLGALVLLIVLARKERMITDEMEIVLDELALAVKIDEAIEDQNAEQAIALLNETTE